MSAPDRSKTEAATAARGAKAASAPAAAATPAAKRAVTAKPATATGKPVGDKDVALKVGAKRFAAKKKPVAKKAPKRAAAQPRHAESRLAQVLVEPIVSEKATLVSEKRNQVMFKVLRDATKPEIKAAVELMFKVEVDSVQTLVQKGKVKKFGRSIGRRDHVKKAYVCLKQGQELNFSGEGA